MSEVSVCVNEGSASLVDVTGLLAFSLSIYDLIGRAKVARQE